jgi:hypothetical protein
MRKQNSPGHWPLAAIFLIIPFIFFFLFNACKKMDSDVPTQATSEIETRFFNQHVSALPQVKSIAGFLKRENDKNSFVERMVDKAGFPRWDKAIIVSGSENINTRELGKGDGGATPSTVLFVPFAKDSQNVVSAALRVTMTARGDTLVKILLASNVGDSVKTGMKPRHLSLLLMKLDNAVFGHTLFEITDNNAFAGLGKNVKYVKFNPGVPPKAKLVAVEYTLTVCVEVTSPGFCDGQVHGVAPGHNPYCTETLCDSIPGPNMKTMVAAVAVLVPEMAAVVVVIIPIRAGLCPAIMIPAVAVAAAAAGYRCL